LPAGLKGLMDGRTGLSLAIVSKVGKKIVSRGTSDGAKIFLYLQSLTKFYKPFTETDRKCLIYVATRWPVDEEVFFVQ
jgi:hypothetical protein